MRPSTERYGDERFSCRCSFKPPELAMTADYPPPSPVKRPCPDLSADAPQSEPLNRSPLTIRDPISYMVRPRLQPRWCAPECPFVSPLSGFPKKNLRAISPRAQPPPWPWFPAFPMAHSPLPRAYLPPPPGAPRCPSARLLERACAHRRSLTSEYVGRGGTEHSLVPGHRHPHRLRRGVLCSSPRPSPALASHGSRPFYSTTRARLDRSAVYSRLARPGGALSHL